MQIHFRCGDSYQYWAWFPNKTVPRIGEHVVLPSDTGKTKFACTGVTYDEDGEPSIDLLKVDG